jgi:fibroblast growth factor receptor 2
MQNMSHSFPLIKDFNLHHISSFFFLTDPQSKINNTPEHDNDVQSEDEPLNSSNTISGSLLPTNNEGFPPYFTNPNNLNALNSKPSGNMIRLRCPAKGDPEPRTDWMKNGEIITKDFKRHHGEAKINGKGFLSMEDLVPSDSGNYTCIICNEYGCINFTTKLEVNGEFKKYKIF